MLDGYIRKGFVAVDPAERENGRDLMWYIWLHRDSPLFGFGKDKMATFERYFLAEKETHQEKKNPYYRFLEDEEVVNRILEEFGLSSETGHIINGHVPVKSKNGENPVKCGGKVLVIDGGFSKAYQKETGIAGSETGHIINGHVPVKSKNGENPVKCGGKVLVIDGGFSKAYQKETGIAGYTLIYNSYGLILAAHDPFESTEAAIEKGSDIHSETIVVKRVEKRKLVGDTDVGMTLKENIADLEKLLEAYRTGALAERIRKK